jgi:hypothetical protein
MEHATIAMPMLVAHHLLAILASGPAVSCVDSPE